MTVGMWIAAAVVGWCGAAVAVAFLVAAVIRLRELQVPAENASIDQLLGRRRHDTRCWWFGGGWYCPEAEASCSSEAEEPHMTANDTPIIYPTCVCGKKTYRSRKEARHTARTLYPGSRMQTYRCERGLVTGWHFGHPIGHERVADARREGRNPA